MKLLIKRNNALGDVILTLPIVQWFCDKYSEIEIDFLCYEKCAIPYQGHPNVNIVNVPMVNTNIANNKYDRIIDLNLAYEKRPNMHIVEAYAQECGIDPVELKQPKINGTDDIWDAPSIVIHAAKSWNNRTWPERLWVELVDKLSKIVPRIAFIGRYPDFGYEKDNVISYRDKLSFHGIYDLISKSDCFIGADSGLLHLASATQTPIIGLFTCAKAEYRRPWRENCKFEPVEAAIDCYGCLHTQNPPVTYCDCPTHKNYECLKTITVQKVMDAYRKIMQ